MGLCRSRPELTIWPLTRAFDVCRSRHHRRKSRSPRETQGAGRPSIVEGVRTDPSRDALLTDFGKKRLTTGYALPGELYQVVSSSESSFANRMMPGMVADCTTTFQNSWFMPATPVLSNGGGGPRPADLLLPERGFRLAWTGSSRPGTRTSGWPPMAAASAPIGVKSARSARRSARTGRPRASSPSSARDGFADAGDLARDRCAAARRPAISTSSTRKSRNSSRFAKLLATSTASRSTCTTASTSPTSSWKPCARTRRSS